MKKFLLLIVAVFLMANYGFAQKYEKNIFRVQGAVNFSWAGDADMKVGESIGAVYERLLMKNRPLYLETGLEITQKGTKVEGLKCSAWFIEIPVMVNYKFKLRKDVYIFPSAGLYTGIGIAGKVKGELLEQLGGTQMDTFGDDGACKRFDMGLRFGGTVSWQNLHFGLGMEFGLINLLRDELEAMGAKARTANIFLSFGWKF